MFTLRTTPSAGISLYFFGLIFYQQQDWFYEPVAGPLKEGPIFPDIKGCTFCFVMFPVNVM